MDGFVELSLTAQQLTGVAEVNSSDFSMNIPTTFTRVWDYSRVNGRLHIDVNGEWSGREACQRQNRC